MKKSEQILKIWEQNSLITKAFKAAPSRLSGKKIKSEQILKIWEQNNQITKTSKQRLPSTLPQAILPTTSVAMYHL